jgi:hypothetical protein
MLDIQPRVTAEEGTALASHMHFTLELQPSATRQFINSFLFDASVNIKIPQPADLFFTNP